MQVEKLAKTVIKALEEVKAQDIRVFDVRRITTITDYMVIATGRSNRQVKALADRVVLAAKKGGTLPLGVEGKAEAEWILIDLGEVVVHAMQPAIRDFYQMEKLWGDSGDTGLLARSGARE